MKATENVTEITQEIAEEFNLDVEVSEYSEPSKDRDKVQVKIIDDSSVGNNHNGTQKYLGDAVFEVTISHHEMRQDAEFILRDRLEHSLREGRKMLSDFTACGHYFSTTSDGYHCDKCSQEFHPPVDSHKGALYSLAKAMTTPCKS